MGDLKIASGKEVRAHPSHLFLIILLYGAMGFFWPRTAESTGVYNTPYVLTSEKPHSDTSPSRAFFPSLLQNLLSLFDSQTKR